MADRRPLLYGVWIHMEKPKWLDQTVAIVKLLDGFLDKLDKQAATERVRPVSIIINKDKFPALYQYAGDYDAEWIWGNLCDLEQRRILQIARGKQRDYTGSRIIFCTEAEAIVRQWLNHPVDRTLQRWQETVEQHRDRFPGNIHKLMENPLRIAGRTDDEILEALGNVGPCLNSTRYQRQISARCFWGLSKFLDGREMLLSTLYPHYNDSILQRPVMIHVRQVAEPKGLLIVENQDCFTALADGHLPAANDLILVYSQGFKGAAQRIREPDGVRFGFVGHELSEASREHFRQCWFGTPSMPIWFWGDLDYAGMQILANLKQRFPTIDAWQPGYADMLENLAFGHRPCEDAGSGKDQQNPLNLTGCAYADDALLPALAQYGRFLDQEFM